MASNMKSTSVISWTRDVAAQSNVVLMCDAGTQADATLFIRQTAQSNLSLPRELYVPMARVYYPQRAWASASPDHGQDLDGPEELNDGMIVESPSPSSPQSPPSSPGFPPLPSPSMLLFPETPSSPEEQQQPQPANPLLVLSPTNIRRRLRVRDPKKMKYTVDDEASPKKKTNKRRKMAHTTNQPTLDPVMAPIPKLVISRFQLTAILSNQQPAPIIPSPTIPPSTTPIVSPHPSPPTATQSSSQASTLPSLSFSESFNNYLPDLDELSPTAAPLPSPTRSMVGLSTSPTTLDLNDSDLFVP